MTICLSRDDSKMEEGWQLDAFDDGSLSEFDLFKLACIINS